MPSSRTDETLARLRGLYDDALEALLREELDRVDGLVAEAEALVAELGRSGAAHDPRLLALTRDAHGRLADVARREHDATGTTLRAVRKGIKAVRGYGAGDDQPGDRLSRDA